MVAVLQERCAQDALAVPGKTLAHEGQTEAARLPHTVGVDDKVDIFWLVVLLLL